MINPAIRRSAEDADAAETQRPRPWRPAAASLIWAVPATVTAALGLYQIGVPMLWRDELATWSASGRSLTQLYAMLHHVDAVLGVYYFGIHLWMGVFGDSATAMRLPSVIAMAGSPAPVRGWPAAWSSPFSRAPRDTPRRPGPTRSRCSSPRSPPCCCCAPWSAPAGTGLAGTRWRWPPWGQATWSRSACSRGTR